MNNTSPIDVVMINDPGKDLDDEQAFILAAHLHRKGFINLKGVLANLHPAEQRARLAKGTFDLLGLPDIPVVIGSAVAKNIETYSYELDVPYANKFNNVMISRLGFERIFYPAKEKSLHLVCMSGLTDAVKIILKEGVASKIASVTIMGGIRLTSEWEIYMTTAPDGHDYFQPDDSANNAYDWPAALYLYQALQEMEIPLTVLSRHAAYAAQFPFSLFDRFAETGSPIGESLLARQKPSIEALWRACQAPVGSPTRGKLPASRNRQWFVSVFCEGLDPDVGPEGNIWPYLAGYNQYDPLALVSAIPVFRDKFFIPETVEIRGVAHRTIGLTGQTTGIRKETRKDLIKFISESQLEALEYGKATNGG